jgi:hypothetical protein
MKTLRNSKSKTFIFELVKNTDSNGNTYKCFTQGYFIQNGERKYFTDQGIKNWKPLNSFYSYADAYDDVKAWLNDSQNWGIRYISDFQNVVVFCSEVSTKEFNQLTK